MFCKYEAKAGICKKLTDFLRSLF